MLSTVSELRKKPIYRILISTVFNILSSTDYFGLLCKNLRNMEITTMIGKLAIKSLQRTCMEDPISDQMIVKKIRSQVKPHD